MNTQKDLPETIKEVGFDFSWSEEKVWAINSPVEEMGIEELEWHFEIPFWSTDDGFYNLKPIDVITSPENNQTEYKRTIKSDLSYPIDIMKNKGRWLILDGLHRLAKAKILGKTKVYIRKIPRDKIPEIIK